jgi:hypothetical protein
VWSLGCVLYGTRSTLRFHGVRNSLLAQCQSCAILYTFCAVASPVCRVSTSEVIEIMGPVSDNGETRPGPYFRCDRCSAEGFCCCHGHSCVTIVEHSQHAYCLQASRDQAVCLLCTNDVSTMYLTTKNISIEVHEEELSGNIRSTRPESVCLVRSLNGHYRLDQTAPLDYVLRQFNPLFAIYLVSSIYNRCSKNSLRAFPLSSAPSVSSLISLP